MRRILDRIKKVTFFIRLYKNTKNWVVNIGLMLLPNRSITEKISTRDEEVIVSLTSYPARFDNLYISIKSIMYQSMRPDRIVLFLDDDVDIERDVPRSLKNMTKYGLEIVTRPYRLKCHKKYLHAITENPNVNVITIDDDSMYHYKTIEELYNTHIKYPKAVCAKRVHRILFDTQGKMLPYEEWDGLCTTVSEPSYRLCATGVGGVLYPPHCLIEEAFDVDMITKLSLGNDDIWLKYMENKSKTKTVWVPTKHIEPYQIPDSQTTGLYKNNVDMSRNDKYLDALNEYFKFDWEKFI